MRLKAEGDKLVKTISKNEDEMRIFKERTDATLDVLSGRLGDIEKDVETKTGLINRNVAAMNDRVHRQIESERGVINNTIELVKDQLKGEKTSDVIIIVTPVRVGFSFFIVFFFAFFLNIDFFLR